MKCVEATGSPSTLMSWSPSATAQKNDGPRFEGMKLARFSSILWCELQGTN
jgi:hypothetical protein